MALWLLMTYTIFFSNNTDQEFEGGNIGIGAHEDGGEFWCVKDVIIDVNIPANSQVSYSY